MLSVERMVLLQQFLSSMNHTNRKKLILGLFSFLLIATACYRSSSFALGNPYSTLDRHLFLLHISPIFRPFTKVEDYENTKSLSFAYLTTLAGEDVSISPLVKAKEIGGPHAAKIVVYETLIETPYQMYLGNRPAVESVVRKLYCTSHDIVSVKIKVFDRVKGAPTHLYVIPCQ